MVFVRNQDRDPVLALDLVFDLKDRVERPGALDLKVLESAPGQMVRHRPLRRRDRIGLCADVARRARLVGSPVVQQLRHVHDLPGAGSQPQYHIVILTAVKAAAEQLRPLEQFSREHAEMTDVIVRSEIVGRKVRFEVQRDHVVDAVPLERRLIAVYIIRALLVDHFHILVQRAGMQDVILVKQPDVLARGKL